jgi:Zn finger protein HypA/HybF involved in hydrogenase expression
MLVTVDYRDTIGNPDGEPVVTVEAMLMCDNCKRRHIGQFDVSVPGDLSDIECPDCGATGKIRHGKVTVRHAR